MNVGRWWKRAKKKNGSHVEGIVPGVERDPLQRHLLPHTVEDELRITKRARQKERKREREKREERQKERERERKKEI